MARTFDRQAFDRAYQRYICEGTFQEVPEYYPRYKSRYEAIVRQYAEVAGAPPLDVLEVGGGQHALLAKALWNDRAVVADIPGKHFDYLKSQGVETAAWNLVSNDQPFENRFDAILFSEVIEHLPIPGHVVLERLRKALRPGGILVLSTPNLYRLRNVVYMALGINMFDHFTMPTDHGLGHVLEYSEDHLRWQLETAGFQNLQIKLRQFHHTPTKLRDRVLSVVGYPLFLYPRFRDNLLAVATAP